MSDMPPQPNPAAPPPYPEITPNPGFEEAPQTAPAPQEEETGRPHDAAGVDMTAGGAKRPPAQ